jgi:hypothetical protein
MDNIKLRIQLLLDEYPTLHDTGMGYISAHWSSHDEALAAGRQRLLDKSEFIGRLAAFLLPVKQTFNALNNARDYADPLQQLFGTIRTGEFVMAALLCGVKIRRGTMGRTGVRVAIDVSSFRKALAEALEKKHDPQP